MLAVALWAAPVLGQTGKTALIRRSAQYGGMRLDITVNGRPAFLVVPPREPLDNSKPWVWFSPAVQGQQPGEQQEWFFSRLVSEGFSIAGIDLGGPSGAALGSDSLDQFYTLLTTKYRLAKRPCLLAASWGALPLYQWASKNADRIRCMVGVRPLVNIESDPSLAAEVARAQRWTAAEWRGSHVDYNPVDQLGELAARDIPILHLHGPGDTVVPAEPNTGLFSTRYLALGGPMEVLPLTGEGSDVWQSSRVVSFILSHGIEKAD
jgi:pimeloyl-ACP methyl ester carboxylesterase